MNVRIIPVCGALLLMTSTVQGQACLGLASLESRPMNVTIGALFTDGAKSGDARFGFGTQKAFGGVNALVAKADGISGTTKGAGVDGGLSFAVGAQKRAMVCPVASAEYLKSPDTDDGQGGTISASGTGASAGLSIGGLITSSSGIGFIPFGTLRAAYTRVKVSEGSNSATTSDTYGILSGGVSFVFNPSVLLRPFVQIPFSRAGDNEPSYGVGVSFAFGTR